MRQTRNLFALLLLLFPAFSVYAQEPIDIGSRRELFVDDYLIDKMAGSAKLHLHKPTPHEVALVTDRPWEGNTCAYYTIFRDGDIFRMYYRGSHYDVKTRKATHRELTCYAESKDGIRWYRPDLGLFAFNGSKQNNIVWDGLGTHDFTPFKDESPNCPKEARYKALARGRNKNGRGLFAFQSPDGIHWKFMSEKPVITKGAFDSQNLAFWDEHSGIYRAYHRTFSGGVRSIVTETSKDFLHWTEPVPLTYPGAAKEHLYTNAIRTYPRAPHLFIGFPTRFRPDRGQQTEPLFMSSRDGRIFKRWKNPVIPVTAPKDRDGNRSNYMTWSLVSLAGKPKEYSVYATEAYYTGPDSRVRRFSYRVDGFVSVRADSGGGEVLTKPINFDGGKLVVNMKTKKAGSIRVEIQDSAGKPLPGFRLADCAPIRGDAIERVVSWNKGGDVGKLVGRPVRLRFVLRDADLYSMRFAERK